MRDLYDLMIAAVTDQPPATPPPLEDLVRRGRRRRNSAVIATAAAATVAVVLPIALLHNQGRSDGKLAHPTQTSVTSPAPSPAAPVAAACKPADISTQVAIGGPGSGFSMGTAFTLVRLTNTSNVACTLAGSPSVSFANASSHHQTIQYRDDIPPPGKAATAPITLTPGDHAQFYLLTSTVETSEFPNCEGKSTPWTVALRPGEAPFRIGPFALPACEGTTITVSPYTSYSAPGYQRALTRLTPARPKHQPST